MKLWKKLSESEKIEFEQWARDNYKPLDEINGSWHPVIQIECAMINEQWNDEPWPLIES